MILGFTKNVKQATEYKGEMTPHRVRAFLRTVIYKENQELNFEIISPEEYSLNDCNEQDKKTCLIVIENENISLQEFEEAAFELQKEFSQDPVKMVFLKQNTILEDFFTQNQLDFVEDNSIFLYKGKYQKGKVVDFDFSQELVKGFSVVLQNLLSSMIQLEKVEVPLDQYTRKFEEL